MRFSIAAVAALVVAVAPRVAFADVAPGPSEFAFLGFGALVMSIPAGLAIGSVVYLVLASRGATTPEAAEERKKLIWERKAWRRSVKISVMVVFVGLVALALVSFYGFRRRGGRRGALDGTPSREMADDSAATPETARLAKSGRA